MRRWRMVKNGMPEMAKDAPNLEEVGGRLNPKWMARWISDPKSLRPDTSMPNVFHGKAGHDGAGGGGHRGVSGNVLVAEDLDAVPAEQGDADGRWTAGRAPRVHRMPHAAAISRCRRRYRSAFAGTYVKAKYQAGGIGRIPEAAGEALRLDSDAEFSAQR